MESSSTLVIKLPRHFGAKEARKLRAELKESFVRYEASVVFDLSQVRQINTAGADSLLRCIREVIKQDGSVRLAEVSPEAATLLELIRMDCIFEMFPRFSEEPERFTEKTFEEGLAPESHAPQISSAVPAEPAPQTVAA